MNTFSCSDAATISAATQGFKILSRHMWVKCTRKPIPQENRYLGTDLPGGIEIPVTPVQDSHPSF